MDSLAEGQAYLIGTVFMAVAAVVLTWMLWSTSRINRGLAAEDTEHQIRVAHAQALDWASQAMTAPAARDWLAVMSNQVAAGHMNIPGWANGRPAGFGPADAGPTPAPGARVRN